MTLGLDQVVDLDCVVSLSPLKLDIPSPTKYARGQLAILRRVLYSWARDATISILALEGTRWEPNGLLRYRNELEGLARAIPFVAGASVPLILIDTRLIITGRIALVDGATRPLEVSTADAPAAILALGAATP